jgi:hypothetical protein
MEGLRVRDVMTTQVGAKRVQSTATKNAFLRRVR